MASKQCDKCGEMVDETKAFCPACGNALVEEERRQKASEYDKLDSTVQFGQTMYDQMLSDMGLNISKSPNIEEKRVEIIAPVTPSVKQPEMPPAETASASNTNWFVIGGVIIILGLVIAIVVAALIFLNWSRFR